ncbi:class I SAM-dependent methyltransferase [Paenibacillus typhae]
MYDFFFNSGAFLKARKKIFSDLHVETGQNILFVGVGTGADLPFMINRGGNITGIDLSSDMLDQAKKLYPSAHIKFIQMDAQSVKRIELLLDTLPSAIPAGRL